MLFGSSPAGGFVASGCAGATGSVVAAGAVATGTSAAAFSFATSFARSSSRLGPLVMSFMGAITFLPATLTWSDSSAETAAGVVAFSGMVFWGAVPAGLAAASGVVARAGVGGSEFATPGCATADCSCT